MCYYEQLCANKRDNLEKVDKFIETKNLPRLNQEQTSYNQQNQRRCSKKSLPRQNPEPDDSTKEPE